MATKDISAAETQMDRNNRRMCNVKTFVYSEKPSPSLSIKVLGLSPSSFDRDCKPRVMSLMYIDGHIRRFAQSYVMKDGFTSFKADSNGKLVGVASEPTPILSQGNDKRDKIFIDYIAMVEGMFAFGAWADFTFTRAVWDLDVRKWDLELQYTLGHVGNCGIINKTHVYACLGDEDVPSEGTEGKTLLWTNTYQQVAVGQKTRQVTTLPQWFKDKYTGKGCIDKNISLRPFRTPALTFRHDITVRWSDTDDYGHANWSSYIRWAEDALHAAMLPKNKTARSPTGALSAFKDEFLSQGLSRFQDSYFNECLEGEMVEVHLWQEKGGPPELVWLTIKKDGEEINQGKLWYFTKET